MFGAALPVADKPAPQFIFNVMSVRAGQEYRPPNIVIMIIIAAALAIFTRSRPT